MTTLTVYPDTSAENAVTHTKFCDIAGSLAQIGVLLERWQATRPLSPAAGPDEVLAAYSDAIERLKQHYQFQSVDVVSITPGHPNKDTMRAKFLSEHTHDDFEIRFFVDGSGLFYLHARNKVYVVLCEQGDLISVPAHTPHWFDMGETPDFKCIRLFTTAEGWVGHSTGSEIARNYPGFDEFVAEYA